MRTPLIPIHIDFEGFLPFHMIFVADYVYTVSFQIATNYVFYLILSNLSFPQC